MKDFSLAVVTCFIACSQFNTKARYGSSLETRLGLHSKFQIRLGYMGRPWLTKEKKKWGEGLNLSKTGMASGRTEAL